MSLDHLPQLDDGVVEEIFSLPPLSECVSFMAASPDAGSCRPQAGQEDVGMAPRPSPNLPPKSEALKPHLVPLVAVAAAAAATAAVTVLTQGADLLGDLRSMETFVARRLETKDCARWTAPTKQMFSDICHALHDKLQTCERGMWLPLLALDTVTNDFVKICGQSGFSQHAHVSKMVFEAAGVLSELHGHRLIISAERPAATAAEAAKRFMAESRPGKRKKR